MTSTPTTSGLMAPTSTPSSPSALVSEHMSDEELLLVQKAHEIRASFPHIELLTNKLAEHKKNIHETAKKFPKYEPKTEDRKLSYSIFNNHIRNFQDVLVDFMKFVKVPEKYWTEKAFFRGVRPTIEGWYHFDWFCAGDDPYKSFFLFMRCDPRGGYDADLDEEHLYGTWVAQLDVLVDRVWEEFKEMRFDFWMERERKM
jgi:hypothetical protein